MNNTDKYTSLELSKKLKEAGCEIESEKNYVEEGNGDIYFASHRGEGQSSIIQTTKGNFQIPHKLIAPAYDIMNDICVVHAKEFFGLDKNGDQKYFLSLENPEGSGTPAYEYCPQVILSLLQQGKKEDAEGYIIENSIFFNNKEK